MATYNYSYQGDEENAAKAVFRDMAISSKHTIEICARLRNRTVGYAKDYLEAVKKKKTPVKFTRFTEGAGHKTSVGAGKYPFKSADQVLKAIKAAESNAISKGLSSDLKIVHLSAQRASTNWHYGRHRRRQMKRTHIEVVVMEVEKKERKADLKSKEKEIQDKEPSDAIEQKKEKKEGESKIENIETVKEISGKKEAMVGKEKNKKESMEKGREGVKEADKKIKATKTKQKKETKGKKGR